ncbi:MAG: roadblock/LC7 domain-containing protein [Desulfamplus sp.]|nr:roadblock/LC7 domain-containing protein [Desulfamplus sp.]MBF0209596.1 roadblock/LC7 domain-containing protein [Desulfamplus sp.]MBF0241789.1 roadblock/LC7 domain-containing protein [Desulfamplus sp.]MBF0390920.1 roadblock/LC7 domain-containing protein [Desulfamplus sp.]
MKYPILTEKQLDAIDQILQQKLIKAGVRNVMLIDMAGNTISKQDNGQFKVDTMAFAALAAGNFAAVEAMAKLVGESEFSLLFHKGETASVHFSKINKDFLLITMFQKDISLGIIRLKVTDTIDALNKIIYG